MWPRAGIEPCMRDRRVCEKGLWNLLWCRVVDDRMVLNVGSGGLEKREEERLDIVL